MEKVRIIPGKYIIAVSGGVDSVVLLDVLKDRADIELIVAHVDHGIRDDSAQDELLVRQLADSVALAYETMRLKLGERISEDAARRLRHEWLEAMRQKYQADAILTAHHMDDVLETIFINLIRGTGWRGLSSLRETERYKRPMIDIPKGEIVAYAIDHDLRWNEDSTNDDMRYLRNYVRAGVIGYVSPSDRQGLFSLYQKQCKIGEMITAASTQLLRLASDGEHALSRYWLIMTPDGVARELLRQKYGALTTHQLGRLLVFARTARHGAKLQLSKGQEFMVTSGQLIVGTS